MDRVGEIGRFSHIGTAIKCLSLLLIDTATHRMYYVFERIIQCIEGWGLKFVSTSWNRSSICPRPSQNKSHTEACNTVLVIVVVIVLELNSHSSNLIASSWYWLFSANELNGIHVLNCFLHAFSQALKLWKLSHSNRHCIMYMNNSMKPAALITITIIIITIVRLRCFCLMCG